MLVEPLKQLAYAGTAGTLSQNLAGGIYEIKDVQCLKAKLNESTELVSQPDVSSVIKDKQDLKAL